MLHGDLPVLSRLCYVCVVCRDMHVSCMHYIFWPSRNIVSRCKMNRALQHIPYVLLRASPGSREGRKHGLLCILTSVSCAGSIV
jgi:hypothetical protein